MMFYLLLFLTTSKSTTSTMRVILLRILQHLLNYKMQLTYSLNISMSDTSSLILLL
jgi:hypothetical protein